MKRAASDAEKDLIPDERARLGWLEEFGAQTPTSMPLLSKPITLWISAILPQVGRVIQKVCAGVHPGIPLINASYSLFLGALVHHGNTTRHRLGAGVVGVEKHRNASGLWHERVQQAASRVSVA